jgi:hypothetical protein
MSYRNTLPILAVLVSILGCSGGSTPLNGTCFLNGSTWTCPAPTPDGSSAVPGSMIPQCPPDVASGNSCSVEATVDTTNPQMPAHYDFAEGCFTCGSNGVGNLWYCESRGWGAGGVFACSP